MQNLSVKKGELVRIVNLPSSKSYANRALIISSLLKRSPVIKNLPQATDVTVLLQCLEKIGLKYHCQGDGLSFENSFPECETHDQEVQVGEGGTTARFLAAMVLLGKARYRLILGERLKERPWEEFIGLVHSLGAKAELSGNVLSLQGPIKLPAELQIDCSKTTQFASAFQLLSVATNTKIVPLNMASSQSYWAMTEKMVEVMPGLATYEVPLDWSSASYPMAFAALNHPIAFPGLRPDRFQADSKFYSILSALKCIEETEDGLVVSPLKEHHSVIFNVSDCLDLVPTLAYFLAHVEGTHRLSGIGNLVHKESDRLTEVIKLLKTFGRKALRDGESLVIEGRSERSSDQVKLVLPNDHRMVMVGALFLLHHGGGEVGPAGAVTKSYPDFFKLIP